MKTNLLLITTLFVTMAFSITACSKEADPVVIESVGTPVMEETTSAAVENSTEAETVEKAAPVKEVETPAVVDVAANVADEYAEQDGVITYEDGFSLKKGDYVVTDEEAADLDEEAVKDITGTYLFLRRFDKSLPENACLKTMGTVYMRYDEAEVLNFLNEDFAKAFDIIEKCGLDITTNDGKSLKAAEVRLEIIDYDTFFEALDRIIEYTGELSTASGDCKRHFDNATEEKDLAEAQKMYDGWILYGDSAGALAETMYFYSDLADYLE